MTGNDKFRTVNAEIAVIKCDFITPRKKGDYVCLLQRFLSLFFKFFLSFFFLKFLKCNNQFYYHRLVSSMQWAQYEYELGAIESSTSCPVHQNWMPQTCQFFLPLLACFSCCGTLHNNELKLPVELLHTSSI